MEPWEDELPATPGCWRITLVPPSELPPEDVELWMEHDLALAGSTVYPLALRTGPEGDERPDARLLSWCEAVLAALAATTEEEMDTGRWEKEVATADGPVRLVLSLPDVLEPPFTDSFPLDADDDRPEAERRAEDLADEANESWGRRQIHLARRAVALWPDCFDGWLVLAHRALDPESARDLYAEAVAATERLMPGLGKGEAGPRDEDEEPWLFPWIWARIGLAKSLWSLGSREEAVGHLQRILAVDPSDHERVRYLPRRRRTGKKAMPSSSRTSGRRPPERSKRCERRARLPPPWPGPGRPRERSRRRSGSGGAGRGRADS